MASTPQSKRQQRAQTTGRTASDRSRSAHTNRVSPDLSARGRGVLLHRTVQGLCELNTAVGEGDAYRMAFIAANGRKGDPLRFSTTPGSISQPVSCVMPFMPSLEWSCVGTEVVLGDRRADILFENPAGEIVVVELKTGGHKSADRYEEMKDQCGDIAEAARSLYGQRLYGLAEIHILTRHLSKFWLNGQIDTRESLEDCAPWEFYSRWPEED